MYRLTILIFLLFPLVRANIFKKILAEKPVCSNEIECLIQKTTKNNYCSVCEVILPIVRNLIRKNQTEDIKKVLLMLCVGSQSTNQEMCSNFIKTYWTSLEKVAKDSPLKDNELCASLVGCSRVTNSLFQFELNFKAQKKVQKQKVSTSGKTKRILQLTDIHIDYEYQPGSLAECDQVLCCRNSSKSENSNLSQDRLAGYWGDYRSCGIPPWTIENLFEHLSKNENFDFIFWTGDLLTHSFWQDSQSTNEKVLKNLTELFKKYFPNKKVYSVVGNHDTNPHNLFPTRENLNWLYNQLSEEWSQTGVPESQVENIKKGAYYTIVLTRGLRLISINNNLCYPWNFWIYINTTEMIDQFKWLVETLQQSEENGEKVYIIGHVNPSGCIRPFSEKYYEIVNRYQSTIVGQFFGHKHYDYFEMFYDLENLKRPIGIAYMAGSVSTYSNHNPSYRIYTINRDNFEIVDHETHIMNLTDANLSSNPKWIKEYSAVKDYGLKGLSPNDWNGFVNKMWNDVNGTLFKQFHKNFFKSYDKRPKCDSQCAKRFVCKLKQARSDNFIQC